MAICAKNIKHKICYAVKANSNVNLLQHLNQSGLGFDVVSGGELQRALYVNANPHDIVFSGVGKQHHEIKLALENKIFCINVESESELRTIETIAEHLNTRASIALRFNPGLSVNSHPYLNTGGQQDKFGIAQQNLIKLVEYAASSPHLDCLGFSVHVGSQLSSSEVLIESLKQLASIIEQCGHSLNLRYLNIGGGLGVAYHHETFPLPSAFLAPIWAYLPQGDFTLVVEPGRSIVANCGFLATQVIYQKQQPKQNFLVVDAAMNDLMRPALYQAEHQIIPVTQQTGKAESYCLVGPVCESGDVFNKRITISAKEKDYLLFKDAGAYGFSMSSNYNSRPKACEVLIQGDQAFVIRKRESFSDLIALEQDTTLLS